MIINKLFVEGKIFPVASNAITFGFDGIMTKGDDYGKDFHIELGFDAAGMPVFDLQFPQDFELRPSGILDAFTDKGGANYRSIDFIKLGPINKGGRV